MIIGSVVSVFLKDKIHGAMRKMNSDGSSFTGIVLASMLGVASPLCMYGTIPIAASFSKSGIKDEWLAAFMMSSILLNPQLIIYSAALGIKVLSIRIVTCFLCGISAGVLIRIFYKKSSFFTFSSFDEPKNKDTDPNLFIRFLKNLYRNVKATGGYFLVGVLLSALFQRYIPQDAVTFMFGGNEAWGVLMASTVGVPLYVCGGGTIPILKMWLANGMSLGSAAAFMITGPATKITNLGAL
ncbi:permease, partial [Ruminococcus sp.]|uniref:permease n=1 Tax=Ruminococcus sp. TaxID=41978 RepID=UPI0034250AAE